MIFAAEDEDLRPYIEDDNVKRAEKCRRGTACVRIPLSYAKADRDPLPGIIAAFFRQKSDLHPFLVIAHTAVRKCK